MTTINVVKLEDGKLVRPPRVLVPLIKEDLKHGKEAADEAGQPHYKAAGEKMIEAREQMSATEFFAWSQRNFKLGRSQTSMYMSFVRASSQADGPTTIHQFRKSRGMRQTVYPRPWHEAVKESIEEARAQMERIRQESLSRQQERDAERMLAMRVIDIGFKVLAKELHPDKGGSRDVMSRLNRVRDRLKGCA